MKLTADTFRWGLVTEYAVSAAGVFQPRHPVPFILEDVALGATQD